MSTALENGWMIQEVPTVPPAGRRASSSAVQAILNKALTEPGAYLVFRAPNARIANSRYATLKGNITRNKVKGIKLSTRKLDDEQVGVYVDSRSEGERL